jgi:hypothetical protein
MTRDGSLSYGIMSDASTEVSEIEFKKESEVIYLMLCR